MNKLVILFLFISVVASAQKKDTLDIGPETMRYILFQDSLARRASAPFTERIDASIKVLLEAKGVDLSKLQNYDIRKNKVIVITKP